MATLLLFIVLSKFVQHEIGEADARRTLLYFALFPTAFFLFAGYTESLFILLALLSFGAAKNGRFLYAGLFGFLATATRHTGWVLILPLAYEAWRQWPPHTTWTTRLKTLCPAILPPLALLLFMGWRWSMGLPDLTAVYQLHWHQVTGLPGQDIVTAIQTLFFGGTARNNETIALSLDFASLLLLLITTGLAWRRLGNTYFLYASLLLFFMLLPTSEVKPLYSFSRYALAFFPAFMMLGVAGRNPWLHRLILYSSLILYLFFSGQFFIWGWVA